MSTKKPGEAGSDPFAPKGAAEVRKATLTLNMTHRSKRSGVTKQAIEQQLRDALVDIPGARIRVSYGGSVEKYVLVLSGEDSRQLSQLATTVEQELRTLPRIGNVTSTASLVRPELIVRPDAARAADLGVTTAAIAGLYLVQPFFMRCYPAISLAIEKHFVNNGAYIVNRPENTLLVFNEPSILCSQPHHSPFVFGDIADGSLIGFGHQYITGLPRRQVMDHKQTALATNP